MRNSWMQDPSYKHQIQQHKKKTFKNKHKCFFLSNFEVSFFYLFNKNLPKTQLISSDLTNLEIVF